MFFGTVPVEEAEGGIAVHSIRKGGLVLKKGTRIGRPEMEALAREGVGEIVVARLSPEDVGEDEAAGAIAARLAGPGLTVEDAFTGRANLFAEAPGVLVVDRAAIDRVNRIDESVTIATLPALRTVEAGEMVATVKIIPFAIDRPVLEAALQAAPRPLLSVAPFRPKRVAVVSTLLPGLKDSVVAKTLRVLEERLRPAGATIVSDERVPHEAEALRDALAGGRAGGRAEGRAEGRADEADMVIVFGASAIADRRDVIPAAIEAAGGRIDHFGMPVDPGNLLLVGDLGGRPVLGAPGCARSPKENGFDWVLDRLLADVPVTREDITGMGVGGLLMEIVTRPQPREGTPEAAMGRKVAAVVLAAGRSTRMGGPNKLLSPWRGKPLVRTAVENALASRAASVVVVTGHQAEAVREALAGLPVTFAHNPAFAEGLSTSVGAGIAAVPPDADAAVICLGDMPGVDAALIDALIAAFDPERGALAVVPTVEGRRGNPVLWARRFFPELRHLEGDSGARQILSANRDAVVEIPVATRGAAIDVDTAEDLATLAGQLG
jgi:molybdenum cofactor cytidylyltransferase